MDGPMPLLFRGLGRPRACSSMQLRKREGKKRTSSTDVHPIEPIPTSPPSNGADDEVRAAPPTSSHNGTPLSNDSVELRDETLSDEESGGCPEGTQSELWEHKMRRSLSLSARVERGTNPLRSQEKKKRGGNMFVVPCLFLVANPDFPWGRSSRRAARPIFKYRDGIFKRQSKQGEKDKRKRS